jgi:NAD(P)-dependent dehydrogenase (short-subunit alcohol dehydrogenase family)
MKTALVTGTGCDAGRESALWLGSKNYKILTHGTSMKETLEGTHRLLDEKNIPYSCYLADYSSVDEVVDMCDRILENEDEIEVILHIAGGSTAFGAHEITPQQIVDAVNVNLMSPMIITHKLLPKLTDHSLIVFTSALSGLHAGWYPTDACFDAAKGGLSRFTENMARNLGPKTRVNCVAIGLLYVDDNYKDWRQARAEQIPMGRIAYASDFVKCVEFFLDNEYVSGVSLPLDGGWMAYNVNPGFGTALMEKTS